MTGLLPCLDALGGLLHQPLDPEGLDLCPSTPGAAARRAALASAWGRTHHLGLEAEQAQGVGRPCAPAGRH